MGLTSSSTGSGVSSDTAVKRKNAGDLLIALAGNPNVGKSTVFNALTGMNQHTGNWPGKTVTNAQGEFKTKNANVILADIPGTYSLMAHSQEEEVARNFICFGGVDAVIVVCDATCLERNLNLALQTMEISKNVIICVNLMDEAKRKNIKIDLQMLKNRLNVPVIGVSARKKKTLSASFSFSCVFFFTFLSAMYVSSDSCATPIFPGFVLTQSESPRALQSAVLRCCKVAHCLHPRYQ